jgi:hypothetical protein
MDLQLTVPSLSGRVLGEIETRPEKVEQWLADLPLLNLAETSRRVLSTLTVYNRIALEPELRLKLLELYRYTVSQLALELQKQYVGLPLPLPDKNKTVAEQNRQLHLEMAFGYKWAVLDLAKAEATGGAMTVPRDRYALAIQRAIHYLNQTLVISYQSYAPYPLGAWRELHALFRHAERISAQDQEVADPGNRTLQLSSASFSYRQALLLDLADPYHLPARHVEKIYQYLDRWAGLTRLLPAQAQFDPTCQFLVDLEADRSGIAYTADTVIEQPERYRLLNTVELARKVHAHLTQLRRGETPDLEGLDRDFFHDSSDLLLRLINAWGVHPKRVFRRNARPGAEIEVAVGIDTINYWLNGGVKFMVSSTFVGPVPQRGQVGATERRPVGETSADFEYTHWNVLDESAGGFALAKKGLVRHRVRVGDIVATRAPGASGWSLAAIRWARSASPSEVEIGLQRLTPGADAVVIKTFNEKGVESDFLPALRLPEVPTLRQPVTLLTHAGLYRPEREIYMDDGFRLYKLRVGQLVESTSAFERFEYEIIS